MAPPDDVVMADAAPAVAAKPAEAAAKPPAEPVSVAVALAKAVSLVEKSVATKEARFAARALRAAHAVRQRATADDVSSFVKARSELAGVARRVVSPPHTQNFLQATLPESLPTRSLLLGHLAGAALTSSKMEVEAAPSSGAPAPPAPATPPAPPRALPETEALVCLVAITCLLDAKAFEGARAVASAGVARAAALRRRTLDPLAAKLAFYLALSAERCGDVAFAAIRGRLLGLSRSAALRNDSAGTEVLTCALLRMALHFRDYEGAEQLRSRLGWPDGAGSSAAARYLFYTGRIRAVTLAYSDAKEALAAAQRKLPPAGATAFRATVSKWLVVTQLLLGEIPDRPVFTHPPTRDALAPYFALCASVRSGDLAAFSSAVATHSRSFEADGLSLLVQRLRRTVMRAALRRIAASYSRIALSDVAASLGLPSAADAAHVVAKAVRDGAVDATLDASDGVMRAVAAPDAYATSQPAAAFHARTAFCLQLHAEAVTALRFPPDAGKGGLESADQRRERQAMEAEVAAALAEDGDEGGW